MTIPPAHSESLQPMEASPDSGDQLERARRASTPKFSCRAPSLIRRNEMLSTFKAYYLCPSSTSAVSAISWSVCDVLAP